MNTLYHYVVYYIPFSPFFIPLYPSHNTVMSITLYHSFLCRILSTSVLYTTIYFILYPYVPYSVPLCPFYHYFHHFIPLCPLYHSVLYTTVSFTRVCPFCCCGFTTLPFKPLYSYTALQCTTLSFVLYLCVLSFTCIIISFALCHFRTIYYPFVIREKKTLFYIDYSTHFFVLKKRRGLSLCYMS